MTTLHDVRCGPLTVTVIPAGFDNYIYLLQWDDGCAVVDPGEAEPVLDVCRARDLRPERILITHGHADHVAGVPAMKAAFGCEVIGPGGVRIPALDRRVGEGDTVAVGPVDFKVLETPGHTREHISYYAADPGLLFCGDVLFVAGCGRIMGSDAETMWASLGKLAALPDGTLVFCGHEYTEENLRFALTVEPDNPDLKPRLAEVLALLAEGRPSVPSTLAMEKKTNPFLRAPDVKIFADRRRRKDRF